MLPPCSAFRAARFRRGVEVAGVALRLRHSMNAIRRSVGAIFSAAVSTSRASAGLFAASSAAARRVATPVFGRIEPPHFAHASAACGHRRWCSASSASCTRPAEELRLRRRAGCVERRPRRRLDAPAPSCALGEQAASPPQYCGCSTTMRRRSGMASAWTIGVEVETRQREVDRRGRRCRRRARSRAPPSPASAYAATSSPGCAAWRCSASATSTVTENAVGFLVLRDRPSARLRRPPSASARLVLARVEARELGPRLGALRLELDRLLATPRRPRRPCPRLRGSGRRRK